MKNKLAKIGLGLGLLASQTGVALAQITVKEPTEAFGVSNKIPELGGIIGGIVGLAIIIAALLAFIYLVWGGIEWLTSGGDKAGMEAAKSRITAAFVGLLIVVAAWAITKVIETFFGVRIISGEIKIPKTY